MIAAYWNHSLTREDLETRVGKPDYALYEILPVETEVVKEMRRSYADYQERRYQLYFNGTCLGYVEETLIEDLVRENRYHFVQKSPQHLRELVP